MTQTQGDPLVSRRKLAVSGMAWKTADDAEALTAIVRAGAEGVEVVPCALWGGWEAATPAATRAYRAMLADMGLSVPSVQSILFGVPEAKVFELGTAGRDALRTQVLRVADISADLGSPVIIFGAPGARRRGELSLYDASAIAAPFFRELGDRCNERGVAIGMENNATAYRCDFLVTPTEVADFVALTSSPGVRLHFDTGSIVMERIDIVEEVVKWVPESCHFHVSEPNLAPLVYPDTDGNWRKNMAGKDHISAALGLNKVGNRYQGWISIEMSDPRPGQDLIQTLVHSVAAVSRIYSAGRQVAKA